MPAHARRERRAPGAAASCRSPARPTSSIARGRAPVELVEHLLERRRARRRARRGVGELAHAAPRARLGKSDRVGSASSVQRVEVSPSYGRARPPRNGCSSRVGRNQGARSGWPPDVAREPCGGKLDPCPVTCSSTATSRDECGVVFASFKGHESPLRHRATLASCRSGGHAIWWTVEADERRGRAPAAARLRRRAHHRHARQRGRIP